MERAFANAIRRRSELRQDLAEVEQFLALYERFKGIDDPSQPSLYPRSLPTEHVQMEDEAGTEAIQVLAGVEKNDGVSERRQKGLSRLELKPHIDRIIRDAGRPLTRGMLLNRLDRHGVVVGGEADRAKNMGTIMWRLRADFVNLTGYGYWLRDEPFPEAGYDPNDLNSPENIDYILRQEQPPDPEQTPDFAA